jgi:hypothetical protein
MVVAIVATVTIGALALFTVSLVHGVFNGFLALIALGWLVVSGALALIAFSLRTWILRP